MKKTYTLITLMAALALTGCKKQTFEQQVMADIEHFNEKEAPKRLDMYTTFDSMRYDAKSQTISYFYTLSGDIDESLFPADDARGELLRNVCQSLQLKAHKEHGMNFRYIYLYQQTGKPLLDCTFTPEDYR